ncbi:DUF550 domain-containing protein [Methylobrevis pamukkalensis]|uniref:Uncharacterized protein n=1 Tax=Methylobrevis pamukkalensis TaxID=1439726 RepID=A0A1E3H795_9HYPH|nr:DUF550 domain-containing protein [Methylobrevis pamukkalensis]ODN71646.1 hypothetical protein A6302_00983 [Methylobrevis pamukkalensis]
MDPFETFLRRHAAWSEATFGAGRQTASLTRHIELEIEEVRQRPATSPNGST